MPVRDIKTDTLIGYEYSTLSPPNPVLATTLWTHKTLDVTSGHYGFPQFNFPDVGGPFRLYGFESSCTPVYAGELWRGGAIDQRYVGSLAPLLPGNSPSDIVDGAARAAEAYSRMKPTAPSFNALNSIFELKDLPGMLQQRFLAKGLHEIGDYHLALNFGWKPLFQDIANLVTLQRTAQARLKQLLRDNGKPVRRRITLSSTNEINWTGTGNYYGAFNPVFVTQYYAREPRLTQTERYKDRWWATARFRYWLPGGPRDVKWSRRQLRRIYGLRLAPSVVYRAIPWSWLVDWFTNTGTVLQNMEAGVADRLAADNFYMMRERTFERTNQAQAEFFRKSGEVVSFTGSSSSIGSCKSRIKGDPFGINTNQNQLSGMQLPILGALGLSRVR